MASQPKKYENPHAKVGLSMLSSAIAEPIAGWAGILSGGSLEAMARTRDALTYRPTDPESQEVMNDLAYTMEPATLAAENLNKKFGDTTYDVTGSPTLAGLATAVPTGIMSLGGARNLKFQPSAMNPDIRPSAETVEKALVRTLDPFNLHKGQNPLEAKMFIGDKAADVPPRTKINILKTGEPGTGWRLGPDGKFRFQISDKAAKLKPDLQKKPLVEIIQPNKNIPLEDLLEHDELFKQYPELGGGRVKVTKTSNPANYGSFLAEFDKKGNFKGATIELNAGSRADPRPNEQVLSTLLHEIQHWVQTKEGFTSGSSTGQFDRLRDTVLPEKTRKLQNDMQALAMFKKAEQEGLSVEEFAKKNRHMLGRDAFFRMKGMERGKFTPEEVLDEIMRTQEEVKTLQSLKKTSSGYNYWRTAGEMEARDVQTLRAAERMGLDVSKYIPTLNRKKTTIGGPYEDTIIDPATESLLMPPTTATGKDVGDIRNASEIDTSNVTSQKTLERMLRKENKGDAVIAAKIKKLQEQEAVGLISPGERQRALNKLTQYSRRMERR